MADRASYRVTDVAGARPDIAGRRRRVGEVIELNAKEVEFEISRGTLVKVSAAEAKAAKKGEEA